MNVGRPGAWLDNPIFIKHVRSRLRRQSMGPAVVVVVILCMCIAWGGFQLQAFESGGAFGVLMGLQAIILVVVGATQVGSSVGSARASGVLDFHRVSPLTRTELTLGFFFGAPIREYVLFACTLPFSLLCLAFGTPSVHSFVQWLVLLLASAWLFHGLALWNALLARARANPRGVVGLVIFVVLFGGNMLMSLTRGASLIDIDQRLPFYGISLPWLAIVLLHMAAVLYFVYLAARRKMGAERIHSLSKPQSLAALATLAVLLVGSIWRRERQFPLEIVILYALAITAILLILLVTPNRAEYDKGLRRARRRGLTHLPWYDDLSLNRAFVATTCGLVLATATLASNGAAEGAGSFPSSSAGSFPLAIAAGVLVVAYFGLAHQYFALRFGGRDKIYFTLFLFLAWLLPLMVGMIVQLGSMSAQSEAEKASLVILCLSPVAGIGLTALGGTSESPVAGIQAAAITPALFFAFLFNSLLISARRRAYKSFLTSKIGWPAL